MHGIGWTLALAAGVLGAAAQAETPPDRIRSVLLKTGEACPKAVGNEVVVCRTEEDPYRIPKALRRAEIAVVNQSWVNRAAVIDDVSRTAAGLPNTCSPIGTGGQTGCTTHMLRNWGAERREQRRGTAP